MRTATIRRSTAPETSQHRRQRRARTRSRTTLRTFITSSAGFPEQVAKAIRVLRGHHSASALPQQAEALLTSPTMTMSQQGAWCSYCEQWRAKGSRFCPICATPIGSTAPVPYTAADAIPPWQQHRGQWQEWGEAQRTWSNAPSGHQRLSQSPRTRRRGKDKGGKDKGSKDGQKKGKGAGKKNESGKGPVLPPPPAPPLITAPSPAPYAPQQPAPTKAEQQLGALITALQAQKQDLPSTVLQALEGIAHSSASAEAKEQHRAVTQQARAKRELAKIRAQRHASMSAWAQHLKDVTETVTKQMAEQQAVVVQMDEAEAQWMESLKTASAELARLSEAKPGESDWHRQRMPRQPSIPWHWMSSAKSAKFWKQSSRSNCSRPSRLLRRRPNPWPGQQGGRAHGRRDDSVGRTMQWIFPRHQSWRQTKNLLTMQSSSCWRLPHPRVAAPSPSLLHQPVDEPRRGQPQAEPFADIGTGPWSLGSFGHA